MGQRVGLITNGRDAADRIREEGWSHEFRTRTVAKASIGMRDQSDRLRPIIIETRRADQLNRILETRSDGADRWVCFRNWPRRRPAGCRAMPRLVAVLPEVTSETAVALIHLRKRGYAVTAVLVVFDELADAGLGAASRLGGMAAGGRNRCQTRGQRS